MIRNTYNDAQMPKPIFYSIFGDNYFDSHSNERVGLEWQRNEWHENRLQTISFYSRIQITTTKMNHPLDYPFSFFGFRWTKETTTNDFEFQIVSRTSVPFFSTFFIWLNALKPFLIHLIFFFCSLQICNWWVFQPKIVNPYDSQWLPYRNIINCLLNGYFLRFVSGVLPLADFNWITPIRWIPW